MKRLTDFNGGGLTGGAPFYNEDFYDTQEEAFAVLRDLFEAIVKTFPGSLQSCVVSGLDITANGGNWDISAGIVYLETAAGRELYRYAGGTNVVAATLYLVPGGDISESRTYGDGVSKEFFVTKAAELGTNETGAIVFNPSNQGSDLFTLSDILRKTESPELTISTGAVTITGAFHSIDTESDAAEDDLITISGGRYIGQELILRNANNSRRVWVRRGGNILTQRSIVFPLDNTNDRICLKWDGSYWVETSRSRSTGWANWSTFSNSAAAIADSPLQYMVDAFGVVHWRGKVELNNASNSFISDDLGFATPANDGSTLTSYLFAILGSLDSVTRALGVTFQVNDVTHVTTVAIAPIEGATYTTATGTDTVNIQGVSYQNDWKQYDLAD